MAACESSTLEEVASEGAGGSEPIATDHRAPIHEPAEQLARQSRLAAFTQALSEHAGQPFRRYEDLQAWAVAHSERFWTFFVQWSADALQLEGDPQPAIVRPEVEQASFFPNLRLNYAASLLNGEVAGPGAPALLHCGVDGRRTRWSRGQLRADVARLAAHLSAAGIGPGDHVVAVMRNDARAIIAALAITAVGATLSSASADMGVDAIVDRFEPLAPRLLVAHGSSRPDARDPAYTDKLRDVVARLPGLTTLLALDEVGLEGRLETQSFDELLARPEAKAFDWPRFPFNHPLFIMFSSGTTGKPKCIVHGAGGTLVEHVKEHRLHTDLGPGDRMYFHTSCGWMMWNWQLSALASGVEVVTYDGGITSADRLWRLVAEDAVTVFGTSPAYLRMCEDAGLRPGEAFRLDALRAVLSTGSILHERQFGWFRDNVKPVPLQSISGGTDIVGCFVLGNPMLPVYAGEAQCRSLGLDVQAWEGGAPTDSVGQLVCTNPFPSRPLGFYADEDGSRFHAAYFAQNAGVWTHGDLIEFSARGGARLHGRCDELLNVNGIKFAPAEVHRVLDGMPEIRESLMTEQRAEAGTTTVALVVLQEGHRLDRDLVSRAKREIARRLSTAHVPDRFLQVAELPVTYSGKISDAAVRRTLSGLPVGNVSALRNPASLDMIRQADAAAQAPGAGGAQGTTPAARLAAMWQRLLGVDRIGLDENFFELGGTSMKAAMLLHEVEKSEGVRLPIGVMLQAPTLRKMLKLIESDRTAAATPAAVVCLRPGVGNPVVLMPGLTCTVMQFSRLVPLLQTTRPIYGMEWTAGFPVADPRQRVRDVASRYASQLLAQFAGRPLTICGYSFGGVVGLETARQLHAAGEEIETLMVLDTFVRPRLPQRCLRVLRQIGSAGGAREVAMYLARTAGKTTREMKERFGWTPPQQQEPLTLPREFWPVYQYMFEAMEAYYPAPYTGSPIVYIRAQENGFDLMSIWRRVARRGIEVLECRGEHLELVFSGADALAPLIDSRLKEGAPAGAA